LRIYPSAERRSLSDLKPVVEKFLKTGRWEGDWEEKFKGYIKSVISSRELESTIRSFIGDDYLKEIYSCFVEKIFLSKETLLSKPYISPSYMYSFIRNVVMDLLRRKYMGVEISVGSLGREEGDLEEVFFKTLPPEHHTLEARAVLIEILDITDDKDREVLCYYFCKELGIEFEVRSMSKQAVYKRWERLRKRIRKHVGGVNANLWKEVMDLFVSEVCSELR
jgi:hypothetical protein